MHSNPDPQHRLIRMPASYDFGISLFEVGDVSMCLFSYCCFPCAIAQSRTNMDGSNFAMNFFSLGCVPARWLTRSLYHIPGDPVNDCMVACFCPCCSANQLYQTTQLRGNPSPDGGAHHNMGEFQTQLGAGNARSCLYSTFCMPCAVGTMMETAMGMPWYMGCCCVDVWMARNLIRYQHRLKGNDLMEECALPFGLRLLGNVVGNVIPCAPCIVYGLFVVLSMQLLEETQKRAGDVDGRPNRRDSAGYSNFGYTALGPEFNPSQGEYYLSSPLRPEPSAPVAGQIVHMVGGADPTATLTPTVVHQPRATGGPSIPAGAVVYSAPSAIHDKNSY